MSLKKYMLPKIGLLNKIGTREITFVTVLSYIIGFIITNAYLADYNFVEFSFFHIKFIPIGFIFLFLTGFIFYFFKFIDNLLKNWPLLTRIISWCISIILLIFSISILTSSPVDSLTGTFNGFIFRLDYTIWVIINLCLYFIISNSINKKNFFLESYKDIEKGPEMIHVVFFSLFLITFNLGLFTNLIYPSIPSFLGGVPPVEVVFKTKNINTDNEPIYAKIIYQTPEYILFEKLDSLSKNIEIVMIPFDQIESIKYLGIYNGRGYDFFSKYKVHVKKFFDYN